MPQQDMSSKLGSSPSPTANRVLQNSKDGQKTYSDPKAALAAKHTKSPVKVG